jgi:hypothetical protein
MGKRQILQTKAATKAELAAGISPVKPEPLPAAAVARLDRHALLDLWGDCFADPAPKAISLTLLAFEQQTRRHGALSAALLAKLGRIDAGQDRAATPVLKAGGRLLREWNGVTHVIDVVPDGYLWQGKCHRSLSAIARAITGAHWSGPRFFGLNEVHGANKIHTAPSARRRKAGNQ